MRPTFLDKLFFVRVKDSIDEGESTLLGFLALLRGLSAGFPALAAFNDSLLLPGRAVRGFTGGLCKGELGERKEVVGLLPYSLSLKCCRMVFNTMVLSRNADLCSRVFLE